MMPIQEGAGSGQSGNPLEVFEANLFGLGRQPLPLGIVEPRLLAQLLLEDFDLLLEIFDHVLLVVVDPTGQAKEDELKLIHCRMIRFHPLSSEDLRFSAPINP
jgi:hypothetical protein